MFIAFNITQCKVYFISNQGRPIFILTRWSSNAYETYARKEFYKSHKQANLTVLALDLHPSGSGKLTSLVLSFFEAFSKFFLTLLVPYLIALDIFAFLQMRCPTEKRSSTIKLRLQICVYIHNTHHHCQSQIMAAKIQAFFTK